MQRAVLGQPRETSRNYVFQELLAFLLETANGFFETEPYPRLNLL